jgi:hypothetical protein
MEAPYLMFDNFPGPLGSINGRLPAIGTNAWSVTGPGATNNVAGGGAWTSSSDVNGIAYAQMDLGQMPGEVGFTFEWTGSVTSVDPMWRPIQCSALS